MESSTTIEGIFGVEAECVVEPYTCHNECEEREQSLRVSGQHTLALPIERHGRTYQGSIESHTDERQVEVDHVARRVELKGRGRGGERMGGGARSRWFAARNLMSSGSSGSPRGRCVSMEEVED